MGTGYGPVAPSVNSRAGVGAGFGAVADVNGDGNPDRDAVKEGDIVSHIWGGGSISVFLGNSDGTFQPAVNFSAGPAPAAAAIGDFYGGGKPDLAVTNVLVSGDTGRSRNVSVLLGNGDGNLPTPPCYSARVCPYS